jgi:hypothetical protein
MDYERLASQTIEKMIEDNLSHEGAMYVVYMEQGLVLLDRKRIQHFRQAVFAKLAQRPDLSSHMLPF